MGVAIHNRCVESHSNKLTQKELQESEDAFVDSIAELIFEQLCALQ